MSNNILNKSVIYESQNGISEGTETGQNMMFLCVMFLPQQHTAHCKPHVSSINVVQIGLQPGRTGSLAGSGDALGGRACPGGSRLLPCGGNRPAGRNPPSGRGCTRYGRRFIQVPRRFPGLTHTKLHG